MDNSDNNSLIKMKENTESIGNIESIDSAENESTGSTENCQNDMEVEVSPEKNLIEDNELLSDVKNTEGRSDEIEILVLDKVEIASASNLLSQTIKNISLTDNGGSSNINDDNVDESGQEEEDVFYSDNGSNTSSETEVEEVKIESVKKKIVFVSKKVRKRKENEQSLNEAYKELENELYKTCKGLAWRNFFPSASSSYVVERFELEEFLLRGYEKEIKNCFLRSQIITGIRNINDFIGVNGYEEIACILIDAIVEDCSESKAFKDMAIIKAPVVVVKNLSKILEDTLYEENCFGVAFKQEIKSTSDRTFMKLHETTVEIAKLFNYRKLEKLRYYACKAKLKLKNKPPNLTEKLPVTRFRNIESEPRTVRIPIMERNVYVSFIELLKFTLYGLAAFKKDFKPENLYKIMSANNYSEDYSTWCERILPKEYPIIEQRKELKIEASDYTESFGKKKWLTEIYSSKLVLIITTGESRKGFPIDPIKKVCHMRYIPIIEVKELTEIAHNPATLGLTDCIAIGFRSSVLNRNSRFHNIYIRACEAAKMEPMCEDQYITLDEEECFNENPNIVHEGHWVQSLTEKDQLHCYELLKLVRKDDISLKIMEREFEPIDYHTKLRIELRKHLQCLNWTLFFESASSFGLKADFFLCKDNDLLERYYTRNLIVAGYENINEIIQLCENKKLLCIFIDPKIESYSSIRKLLRFNCRTRPVAVIPFLSRVIKLSNFMGPPCYLIAFKNDIRGTFGQLQELGCLVEKFAPKPVRSGTVKKAQTASFLVPKKPLPDLVDTVEDPIPFIDCELYSPVVKLLWSTLVGLGLKKDFRPWEIHASTMPSEDYLEFCKRFYPNEYPVIEARQHFRNVRDGGKTKNWVRDIDMNQTVLIYVKTPVISFPIKKIARACHRKGVPLLLIEELTEIAAHPSTLNFERCTALSLRAGVLNRKNGFYGLYRLSCNAVNMEPRPEYCGMC